MRTWVYLDEKYENETHIFTVNDFYPLWVKSFENGIVKLDSTAGISIEKYAEIIIGCFHPKSNFKNKVLAAYNNGEKTEIKGIEIIFNDANILVTREKLSVKKICKEYFEIVNNS